MPKYVQLYELEDKLLALRQLQLTMKDSKQVAELEAERHRLLAEWLSMKAELSAPQYTTSVRFCEWVKTLWSRLRD